MKRLSYDDVYQILSMYANEMLPFFADGWSRFPQGGNAAMIVNYLNDQAKLWYKINPDVATKLVEAATEIIFRES